MIAIKKSYTNYLKMKKENKINELTWERVSFLVDQILAKSKKNKNYNDELMQMLGLFIKQLDIVDFTLMELYSAEMHVLYNIKKEAEQCERYELCQQLVDLITIEKDLYKEWILAMTDEEIKDESLEEYNYTNLFFQNYKND